MAEEKVVAQEAKAEAPANEAPKEERAPRGDRRPHGDRKGGRPDRKGGDRKERREPKDDMEERVVFINRVSKTVKGGRRMKFTALVVVGDHKGQYGFALAKAAEVPDAIKKASEAARKKLYSIHLVKGNTISHEIVGKYGACNVYLKPAPEGTGIIAGGPVRAILELAGVQNVCSKVYGSRAPINIIRATNQGLNNLKSYKTMKELRSKNARSGGGVAIGFEGGQMPLWRRLPKRGFKNVNRVEYAVVNVNDLNRFDEGTLVTPALLKEVGLIGKEFHGVKVLGAGKLEKKLTVQAAKFSKSAEEAIKNAGGTAEVI